MPGRGVNAAGEVYVEMIGQLVGAVIATPPEDWYLDPHKLLHLSYNPSLRNTTGSRHLVLHRSPHFNISSEGGPPLVFVSKGRHHLRVLRPGLDGLAILLGEGHGIHDGQVRVSDIVASGQAKPV